MLFAQIRRLRGGGPPVKRKITVADMKAQETDPVPLKNIYGLANFKVIKKTTNIKVCCFCL